MLYFNQAKRAAAAALALIPLALIGCGKSNTNPSTAPALPTSAAQNGMYPGMGNFAGTCIPITQPIPFTGSGVYFDWANIVGGRVPYSYQQVGQMMVGGTPTQGQYTRQGSDGTISMNISQGGAYPGQTPYQGYPGGTMPIPQNGYIQGAGYANQNWMSNPYQQQSQSNVQGTIVLSQLVQQDIMYRIQMGQIPLTGIPGMNGGMNGAMNYYGPQMPFNGTGFAGQNQFMPLNGQMPYGYNQQAMPNGQQICVSGIAVNVGHYYNTVYGGNVYLYLNGTNNGYILYF